MNIEPKDFLSFATAAAGFAVGWGVLKSTVKSLVERVHMLEKNSRETELATARGEGHQRAIQERIQKVEESVKALKNQMSESFSSIREETRKEREDLRELILDMSHMFSGKFEQLQDRLHKLDKSKISVSDLKAVNEPIVTPRHGMPVYRPKREEE
jgi:DNA anti-recombination protein RmuC